MALLWSGYRVDSTDNFANNSEVMRICTVLLIRDTSIHVGVDWLKSRISRYHGYI